MNLVTGETDTFLKREGLIDFTENKQKEIKNGNYL